MNQRRRFMIAAFLLTLSNWAHAENFEHSDWDALLKKHVSPIRSGVATEVDYRGFAQDRSHLKRYLDRTSRITRVEFENWSVAHQVAFLINIYNAWTVELILNADKKINSIKETGSFFSSPWKKKFIPLFGQLLSLDDIEHGTLRGQARYFDPRIHFALNCASVGCPALRPEAYTALRLEAQLEEATFQFLSDSSRNRLDVDGFKVSSIFKWYRDDFEKNWRGSQSLLHFFAKYGKAFGLDSKSSKAMVNGNVAITYLDYDWKLNASGAQP